MSTELIEKHTKTDSVHPYIEISPSVWITFEDDGVYLTQPSENGRAKKRIASKEEFSDERFKAIHYGITGNSLNN
jgi:hypothetical protein